MKEIIVKFSDRVFAEFQSDIVLKGMSGNLYGIPDEVCVKIIRAIRDDQSEVELVLKKEKKGTRKK